MKQHKLKAAATHPTHPPTHLHMQHCLVHFWQLGGDNLQAL
jgi:hypothetical protein